jgi:uncharacterized protein YegP (UPF0339 family)
MRGKFVVKQTKKGFQFKLLASNGKVIATSDSYPTRRNCLLGIESARKTAPEATVLEVPVPTRGATKAASAKTANGAGTPRRSTAKTVKSTAAPAANGARRAKAAAASTPLRRAAKATSK